MSALLVPVVRVPSCARGPLCVFVYCACTYNKSVLLYNIVGTVQKKRRPPRTTIEIPFDI